MSKIKMLAGVVSAGAVRKNLFHISLLASSGLLAIFDIPWLVGTIP